MKKIFALIGVAFILTFLSCGQKEKASSKDVEKPIPCCSTACEHSTAQSVLDMPDSLFDGRVHVSLNEDFLDKVKKEQEILYSLNLPYATEIADSQNSYPALIQKHGYVLTTRQALVDYYTIVEKEEKLFNELPFEQQKMLVEALDAGKAK